MIILVPECKFGKIAINGFIGLAIARKATPLLLNDITF